MFRDLYFSNKEQKRYFTGIEPCYKCQKLVDGIIFIVRSYSQTEKQIFYFCRHCIKSKPKLPFIYKEVFSAICSNTLPKDAFPLFDTPPSISNRSNSDVFIVANINRDGEKVYDKAIASHDKNFMIDSSAKDPELLAQKIKEKKAMLESRSNKKSVAIDKVDNVSEDEFDSLLDSYKNSEAVLDYDEKKELEDKRG